MLSTFIIKEIKSSIQNYKYILSLILGIIIIPILILLSYNVYQSKLRSNLEAKNFYLKNTKENTISGGTQFKGFRPQSSLSVFTSGVEDLLPDNAVINPNAQFDFQKEWDITNMLSSLYGNFDFLFCISYIFSLLAFAFTFNSITGEKEDGTLKLIFSNPVTKWKFIVSKIISNYLLIVAPLIIGLLLGFIILAIQGFYFSPDITIRILIICLFTLIFLFVLSNIGILISSYSNNSSEAILRLLIIWVIFILFIPKMSSITARLIFPVESVSKINKEKELYKNELLKELNKNKAIVLEKFMNSNGIQINDVFMNSDKWYNLKDKYESEVSPLINEYEQKIRSHFAKIDDDFYLKINRQIQIALFISKISPISSFINLTSDLSNTSYNELLNYRHNAQIFQTQATNEIYSQFKYNSYAAFGNNWTSVEPKSKNLDLAKLTPPNFEYRSENLNVILQRDWYDILLLLLWCVLSFGFTYKRFLKYDIR